MAKKTTMKRAKKVKADDLSAGEIKAIVEDVMDYFGLRTTHEIGELLEALDEEIDVGN
jgi:hypothetical protein